jgi:hypothetical protein
MSEHVFVDKQSLSDRLCETHGGGNDGVMKHMELLQRFQPEGVEGDRS